MIWIHYIISLLHLFVRTAGIVKSAAKAMDSMHGIVFVPVLQAIIY